MSWTAKDYMSAAGGIAVGLSLLAGVGMEWWVPLAAIGTAVTIHLI